jgi:CheY-like chemotaxis protein
MLLIIDDDRDLRDSLIDFFIIKGHEVHSAGNGREALEWLKGRTTYPRLIFLDIVMPVLDGWGFLRERRGDPLISLIPVVVMSGSLGWQTGPWRKEQCMFCINRSGRTIF